MLNYKDFFGQTSKTILFEKFATTDVNGDQMPNLRRFLSEGDVTGDYFYKKVVEKLGVRSFDGFLDKFTPWIYEVIGPGETEDSVEIKYYLTKPEEYEKTGMDPTALNATSIYEMVNKLYEQRKNSGKAQLNFDFSDVARVLSPESQTEKIKQARGDMEAYIKEYYELEEKSPGVPSQEKENARKMFNKNRLAVQDSYTKGSAAMLTLKLGDASTALLEMKSSEDKKSGGSTSHISGIPYYDEDGNLKFRKLETGNEKKLQERIGENPNQKMLEILEDDYKKIAPESMQKSKEITNLVLSNLSTELARTKHDEEFWRNRLETGQRDYKKWMENLADTIAPLIEKFIGVKAFFENATMAGELDSILIVANSTVSELLQSDILKNNLKEFLKIINRKSEEKIWFGIIPAVARGNEVLSKKSSSLATNSNLDNPFGDIWDIQEEEEQKVKGLVSANDAKTLLDICAEAKIMTFYNFKANADTCFGNINKKIYEEMRDKITFNDGSYAVCCLPNFTIIPEEETNVVINQELVEKECQEDLVYIQIPPIYIESSYVAAGMMVGTQQKDLLEKKGLEINKDYPNIRVDLENRVVSKKFQSNMCVENLLPIPQDMSEEIMESGFGFYFSDSKITGDKGKAITHCYVKNARTMAKNETTKKYEEISNQLFRDFVLTLLYDNEEGADPERVKDILSDDIQNWKDQAQIDAKNKNLAVNALLKDSENITIVNNETVNFEFEHVKSSMKLKIKSN